MTPNTPIWKENCTYSLVDIEWSEHSWEQVQWYISGLRKGQYSTLQLTYAWIEGKPYKARYVDTTNHVPIFDTSHRTEYGVKIDDIPEKISGIFSNTDLQIFIVPVIGVPDEYNIAIYDKNVSMDTDEAVQAARELAWGVMDTGNNNTR